MMVRMYSLIAVAISTCACGTVFAEPEGRSFEVLRVALGADPVGLEPALHFHAPGKLIVQHVAESLVAHRNDMSIAPALADSWEVSADGKFYRFKLRSGARFHNGARVTAADVAGAWNDYYLDAATNWHCRVWYSGEGTIADRTIGAEISDVRAVSEDIVEFRLAEPSNLFLARMADVSCAPVIFHPDSRRDDGSWTHLIGTGPYRLVSWDRGERIVLERFEDYRPAVTSRDGYAGARTAYARTLEFHIENDRATQIEALEAGNIDVVLDLQENERRYLDGKPGIAVHTTTTINFWNLLIQTNDPVLSDLRIRRAIAHAIDIEYIAAVLSDGRQQSNPSVISTNSIFHSPVHDKGHKFDPALARSLLEAAGYDDSPIEILTNLDGYPEMHRIGVLVRTMLRAVGLNAHLEIVPWQQQLDERYRTGRFQLQAFGQGGRNHPALVYGKFIGSKDSKARFQWDDAEALRLLREAHVASDRESQQAIYDEMHEHMLATVPTLALFNFEYHDATRDNIRGFHTTPFMRTTLWGVWRE